jgi:hypothetical protein
MRWRDIRFEKPTEADVDKSGNILMLHDDNVIGVFSLDDLMYCIAWMPTSELPAFTPIPDPPEGWRFVQKGEAFDKRAKYWDETDSTWNLTATDFWAVRNTYIVPIDPPKPPEPQYRPYDDAELSGLIGQVVNGVRGYRAMITGTLGSEVYCQGMRLTAQALLDDHAWLDGERCGVRIEQ